VCYDQQIKPQNEHGTFIKRINLAILEIFWAKMMEKHQLQYQEWVQYVQQVGLNLVQDSHTIRIKQTTYKACCKVVGVE
jgi:hypothetical protein